MEQDPDVLVTLVGWVAEQLVALAIGSVIGAIGAKWFFGRKNLEELGRLRREVDELKRARDEQAPPASAPAHRDTGSMDRPTEGPKQATAPAPRDIGSTVRSQLPDSSPPDALLSPKELIALVEGHTDIAAKRMLQPHKGRRHRVRGAVVDVSDHRIDGVQVSLDANDGTTIVLWFDQGRHTETLETLRQGDTVSATGLLRYASNHIALEECALDGIESDSASRN